MQILSVLFEEYFYIQLGSHTVKVITFPTMEFGNIKFGIEASRDVQIHREEVYESIQNKKTKEEELI